jgi:hypothetical protein
MNNKNINKRILYGISVLVIAVLATVNVHLALNKNDLSDILLANVEALAYELPEVTITCSSGSYGQCFWSTYNLCMNGEYTCYRCTYTGFQADYCWCPC